MKPHSYLWPESLPVYAQVYKYKGAWFVELAGEDGKFAHLIKFNMKKKGFNQCQKVILALVRSNPYVQITVTNQ